MNHFIIEYGLNAIIYAYVIAIFHSKMIKK